MEFETSDAIRLQAVVNDQPLEKAVLFQEGIERVGMREVKIEVSPEGERFRVRVTHRDNALNQILKSRVNKP